jgi:hypothetical protein
MDIPTPFGDAFLPGWANQHPFLHLVFIQWPIGLAPALFTWFLPALLGYRRGQMAWIGAAVSLILSVLLPLQFRAEPIAVWYPKVHVWLYTIFYVYALAGLALCGVGVYDRKRSAIWALLATLSLIVVAIHDTLIWFIINSGQVRFTFKGFDPIVAGEDSMVQIPARIPYSIETVEERSA